MNASAHVVLGANGVVGRETLRALLRRGESPVAVARRAPEVDGASSMIADLMSPPDAARAIRGAGVAYFTVGLPYSSRLWREQWPVILRNVIEASLAEGTRLVYFDNVYSYGRVNAPMTEETQIHPSSEKGSVRAAALRILEEGRSRGLDVVIGRSADFFGPGAGTSVFNDFGLTPIAKGKPGTWLFDADQPHSLTYTPDIGTSLAILGSSAAGGTWHLPTASALTGRQYLELADATLPVKVMGAMTMRIGALFNSSARETLEMAHQYTAPYVFDSSRFEREFGLAATPTASAITATLESIRSSR
jgi:nucleoside-diphosphate-sugar epimerase